MSTEILLVRHGNTFEKNETAIRIGARTDLSLTEVGRDQALSLGGRLAQMKYNVEVAYSGPLKRTTEHALLLLSQLSTYVHLETRIALKEIDYGLWEGLTDSEIRARFGDEPLRNWEEHSSWPMGADWSPPPESIRDGISSLLREIRLNGRPALIVTSGGILRFFALATSNGHHLLNLKVKTGNCCKLEIDGSECRIVWWNCTAQEI